MEEALKPCPLDSTWAWMAAALTPSPCWPTPAAPSWRGPGRAHQPQPLHARRGASQPPLGPARGAGPAPCRRRARRSTWALCGVSTDRDRQDIVSVVREISEIGAAPNVIVENDARIGLTGGLSGRPGVVLIAGTGFGMSGRQPPGPRLVVRRLGSAGRRRGQRRGSACAIQAAVRAEDGRTPPTVLRDVVFDFLQLPDPRELIDRVHNRNLTRQELGCLAPRVIGAYQEGDMIAARILSEATAELSQLVATTAGRLFDSSPCELILVGGLCCRARRSRRC